MSVAKSILSLRNVQVAYGKAQALHDVSLEIGEGEVVALIGANGAGKTTTLRAISGLLKPSFGDIEFEGKPIAGKSPDAIVRAGIAQCPEERHVWPEMTVAENLELGAFLCRDRHEVDRRVGMVVHRFPRLRERFKQLAGTLSGGEQQMLAIGRALMSEPKLLLLDEPSLGLSPLMSEEVLSVIVELRGQGITIVLVEQNVHNALSVTDRVYVFETGRVVAHDTAAGLLGNPDLLKAYLGA
jgi:branched-chain amino acid transport system ATP-binding protein